MTKSMKAVRIQKYGGPDFDYAKEEPRGHLDLWGPYVLSYQFPLCTTQAYAYAYYLTRQEIFLITAKRFAEWIERELPA